MVFGMSRKLCFLLCALALWSCSTEAVRNINDTRFNAPEKATLDQIEFAIFLAAKDEHWRLRRVKPGHMEASYSLRQHSAVVDIFYDKEKFSLKYKDSINLKYDGTDISKHYNIWVEKLGWKIRRYASSINTDEEKGQDFFVRGTGPLKLDKAGSGFFISPAGHVVTNAHVIKDCFELRLSKHGKLEVIGKDVKSDLALLKTAKGVTDFAKLREGSGVRLGEEIIAAGYPLKGLLGSGLNVSAGTVSALSGLGGNSQQVQMTAPVQPGSSGGPLLDRSGNVVGVVVSKLNAIAVARITRDIPQNVNFAVNGWTVRPFLERFHVPYQTSVSSKIVNVADVADAASKFTVSIECWR